MVNFKEELETMSGRVTEFLTVIDTIADQTKLLSLNATIEAARAGEAGKGFAVVASEVKSLASQTEDATKQVSETVQEIRTRIANAVESVGVIEQSIDKISSSSDQINSSITEQSRATQQIGESAKETKDLATRAKDMTARSREATEACIRDFEMLEEVTSDIFTQTDTLLNSVIDLKEQLADQS